MVSSIGIVISLIWAALVARKEKLVQLAEQQTTTADTSELVQLDSEEARSLQGAQRQRQRQLNSDSDNNPDAVGVTTSKHASMHSVWATDSDSDVD